MSVRADAVPLQGSLFDQDEVPGLRPLASALGRQHLSDGAWVDVRPGWITGAEALCEELLAAVPWRAERRRMYDRVVDTPRLLRFYSEAEALPHRLLEEARDALTEHYAAEPGAQRFTTAGLCLYRDERDSVAWHGDRIGRGATHDTMVAICSTGAPRRMLLRPRGGGATRTLVVGHGDLVVMGGSCQRTWEHSVPKETHPTGPRISIQFRPHGVR
ncbi:alpha-ketoglutarate-dependent dioxygenase AlkB [Kytococcus sedentarius]|uniref:alpha-ketoglutarate-dependent dioxygenase AlkB n=1 Tax=Kytococcus sedentarius TaxID=1276 RepID=UPI0035BC69D0